MLHDSFGGLACGVHIEGNTNRVALRGAHAGCHSAARFMTCRTTLQEKTMYMVYWSVIEQDVMAPHAKGFDSSDMRQAMHFMEELRARQRAGEGIRFVVMASEHPDSVGHPGVAETGPDYAWKKRRR
jgi:hypothetical protein